MYKVIIFGTGSTAEKISKILKENVKIVCYMDNDRTRWNKQYNNTIILNPDKIKNIKYDYIIIASQFRKEIMNQLIKYKINENKIFSYLDFLIYIKNPFEYKLNIFKNNVTEYEALITGISYFVSGIDESELKKKTINFACDSQDIYFDYHIARYILNKYKTNIKYCIIGLSYYSFQYDLSLSAIRDNVYMYYKTLKKSHNLSIEEEREYFFQKNSEIAQDLFELNNQNRILKKTKIYKLTEENDLDNIGKKQAILDCNKNYPDTVIENTEILKKYLNLLEEKEIKPIIIISPVSTYYSKNFSNRIKEEFLSIINHIRREYKFQYIDYFESKLFVDEDFYDVSHLTVDGGRKFTKILNKIIEW